MIEIKDRWDGSVLYTATTAQDVRTALIEAVRAGADLSGANLSRADLSGADLSRANLFGAYLSRADLFGANLSGANLSRANLSGADLSRANLFGAYLSGADLSGADLSGAYLSGANLSGADLSRANLSGADLSGAVLSRANLSGANGVNAFASTPLHILADQVGKVRAYKLVNAAGEGPQYGGIVYRKGETVEVADADCDPNVDCGAGINLASLDWCIRNWRTGYRVLVVEFTAKDIAAIPTGSDGKFRVRKCRVVGEKNLVDLGLVEALV